MDLSKNMCLMIGRNNTGKTSFMVLFDKFLNKLDFDINDFSIQLREKILDFNQDTDETKIAIQLILTIEYESTDDLCNIAEFIVDLDPDKKDVNILFECSINKIKLLEAIQVIGSMPKSKFIQKNLSSYLEKHIYTFDTLNDLEKESRHRLIKKEFKDVKKLIDFEIIHAKRSVSSSEEKHGMKVLSGLTTTFFNSTNSNTPDKFEEINSLIEDMDSKLDTKYNFFFENFLKTAKEFLGMGELKVRSNLKASEIISDSSEVVYGDGTTQLPEYLNGLGHMNILYLLLNIEIKKNVFTTNNKDIKLLFIEEPEAHTHPQLQYIFARKIEEIVGNIPGMQTIISTHSPHIVSNHPFEHIRYLATIKDENNYSNIKIKNFHKELSEKYSTESEEFQFLKQYLSIESAELFFADKAIFIEGISERILLQHFISEFDKVKIAAERTAIATAPDLKPSYIPLSSQNITIVQAGANAKSFRHFLEFLNIPTVIITDIDTTKQKGSHYEACAVKDTTSCKTSNATIAHYFTAPTFKPNDDTYSNWYQNIINHRITPVSEQIYIAYQTEENNYYPRSFEDALINVNYELLKNNIINIKGLKNREEFSTEQSDLYTFTNNIIDRKSDFASSLLFLSYTKDIKWQIPKYIKEGLEWLTKH